jgi:PAS domain S-box-containing protein
MKPQPVLQTPLRTAAETQLASASPLPARPVNELLHELQVHQIELRMQNEKLHNAQVALEESRDRYFDLYEFAPVGYLSLTGEGRISEINLAGTLLLGEVRVKLLDSLFASHVLPENAEHWQQFWRTVQQQHGRQSCELTLKRGNNQHFYAQLDCVRPDYKTSVLRIALSDMTEREQTAAMLENEAFSLAILNSVSAQIAVLSSTGVILAVNEPWRRFAMENGRQPGTPAPGTEVGANYLRACQPETGLAPDDSMDASDGIRAVLDGRLPSFKLEYPCHSPQQQRWFHMGVTPLNKGKKGSAVIAHTDITERKQAEDERRIAAIAFECQEGLVVMDANRNILRVNQAFTQITGYTQQEAEGKTLAVLRPNRHPASFYDNAWRDINHTGAWQGDLWQRRKNGEDYPARVTMTVVRNKAGQVTHYVGNVTDATRSQLQEQERLMNEAAHRNTLVNEVHHRIKNNLHGITGLLRQFAQKHPETADPINQAIGQVQGISVIHGLQGRADRSSVRLCELTAAIANEIQNLWRTPITLELPPAWQPCVISEKEAVPIALVLNELVLNAVKHGGKAHGQVSITLQKGHRPDRVQIRVTNVGQLSPESRPTGAPHSGLQLIEALMPCHGARIVREQHGGRVITLLELEPPVISVELKKTT